MQGVLDRPIPGVSDAKQKEAKRAFEDLFVVAWKVKVSNIDDASSPTSSTSSSPPTSPTSATETAKGEGDEANKGNASGVKGLDGKRKVAAELKEMNRLIGELEEASPQVADLYELLGVPDTACVESITKAYRTKARTTHPDKNPNDAEATERFQALNEAYEVLTNRERYTEYMHQRPVEFNGCTANPYMWLEEEFGSSQALAPLVGELMFANPFDETEQGPRAAGDAGLKSQVSMRTKYLGLRLEAEMLMWCNGDKEGVLDRSRSKAMALIGTKGGTQLLLNVGRAYVDRAEMVLGKRQFCGLPSVIKGTIHITRRICGFASAAGPSWAMLKSYNEISARLRVLGAKATRDEKAQRGMLHLVDHIMEIIRRFTLVEIDHVLGQVLEGVLEGHNIELKKKKSGAAKPISRSEFEEIAIERAEGIREMGRIFIEVARESLKSYNDMENKRNNTNKQTF